MLRTSSADDDNDDMVDGTKPAAADDNDDMVDGTNPAGDDNDDMEEGEYLSQDSQPGIGTNILQLINVLV